MYSLEKKLGYELYRGPGEVSQISRWESVIRYEIEKNEMFVEISSQHLEISSHRLEIVSVDLVFLFMELIKTKEEKGLCRICLRDSMSVHFGLMGLETNENEKIFILNETRVRRIYNLIKKISFHPNVWVVRMSRQIKIKTKTTEYTLTYENMEKKYSLIIIDKNGVDFIKVEEFEKIEKEITSRLKILEIAEVFEKLYARRVESCARSMMGTIISEKKINKVYKHKNIEELERKLVTEAKSEYSTVLKGYSIRYAIIEDIVFGFLGKDLFDDKGVEVVIEKLDRNNKNRKEAAINLLKRQISIIEQSKY